jgi:hypothetical protein
MERQVRKPEGQQARKRWEKPAFTVLAFKETAIGPGYVPEGGGLDRS